jgi:hypothetical protein
LRERKSSQILAVNKSGAAITAYPHAEELMRIFILIEMDERNYCKTCNCETITAKPFKI